MQHSIHRKERYRILRSILLLVIFGGIVLSLVNLSVGNSFLAGLEIFIAILASYTVWRIQYIIYEKTLRRISIFFACLIMSIMMYAFTVDNMTATIYMWVLIIPLISYHLTGLKTGFMLTCTFLIIATVIFFSEFNIQPYSLTASQSINIMLSIAVSWLLTHFYEHSNSISKSKLSTIASTDSLTGLLNRTTLQSIFDQYQNFPVGMIMFDVDDFKAINDTYGHHVGDDVLIKVAQCLMEHVATRDFTFRLGGEEFCVLLPKASLEDTTKLAQKLIQHLSYQKNKIGEHTVFFTASAGISYYPDDAKNLSELLKVADKRMYQAKQRGKNQVTVSTID